MAWREQLQKGSFRGAPFLWQRADSEVGRKTARHDYPQRDTAWIEDMGRVPREFTLEVYVLGLDYMAARDRLIAACEEPGPGTLVHPTMGTVRVCLSGKVRLSESTDEGGMARFTLPFVLAGDNLLPEAAADTGAAVVAAADSARETAVATATAAYAVALFPGFVAEAAIARATAVLERVAELRTLVRPPLLPAAVSNFIAAVHAAKMAINTLIAAPGQLMLEIEGAVIALTELGETPWDAIQAYRDLFDWDHEDDPDPVHTPSRRQQAANRQAIATLVRTTAVVRAAELTAGVDFVSRADAVAVRDELAGQLETLAESADDAGYRALTDLRFAMVADLGRRSADLARVVRYTPTTTVPALVLAHRLYQDAGRADEIVGRNRIRHPGFVVGGRPLEVLTHV